MSHLATQLGTSFWGIDIGGANIKLSGPSGFCQSVPFAMWNDYRRLSETVQRMIYALSESSPFDVWSGGSVLAVTMTGELADCFESRREGVIHILEQLERFVPQNRCPVYSVDGKWLRSDEAKCEPWRVAASNWHALASWCLRLRQLETRQISAVVDIGSTTVDIVPVDAGRILTRARTDRQRMRLGQLVYTGMERTPIHAIARVLRVDGELTPLMAERFATISDANLVLGCAAEEVANCDTADGRPRTRKYALARLARMVGEDAETLSEAAIIELAMQVCLAQAKQVARALLRNLQHALDASGRVAGRPAFRVLVSGHGKAIIDRLRLFRRFRNVHFEYLEDFIGQNAARCAPALAVSQLCAEHFSGVACNGELAMNCQQAIKTSK